VLLEGPAIEPLLAQVREEYGSGVRIISADKVRSGGFGGFFAKQHYELSVEVPDHLREAASRRPVPTRALTTARTQEPPANSLEQLLQRAESRDQVVPADQSDLPDPWAERDARLAREAQEAHAAEEVRAVRLARESREARDAREARVIREARATRQARGRAEPPGIAEGRKAGMADTTAAFGRRGGTDTGAAFAQLMAGLDRVDDVSTTIRTNVRPEPTVRPFRPAQATGQPVNGSNASQHSPAPSGPSQATRPVKSSAPAPAAPPLAAPPPAAAGIPAPPSTAPRIPAPNTDPRPAAHPGHDTFSRGPVKPLPHMPSLAEMMGGLGMTDEESAAFDQAVARSGPPRTSPADTYSGRTTSVQPVAMSPTAITPVTVPPAQSPALRTSTELRPIGIEPVAMNLISVGMPESMTAEIFGTDTYAGVLNAMAHRPAAPGVPEEPGEILVLAGDLADIVPIGKQLIQQVRLDQTHLLLAGPTAAGTGMHSSKVMHTPAQAEARAERMQSDDCAWIVMMDAPVGGTDPIWVNDMCDSLGATAVWAVVDATRKTADTARHLRTLGDVEALVVHNVELTADPATVLGLGLPIVSLDGRPATPHAWAAMLCSRIAADVLPVAVTPRRTPRTAR
jgi:hypothetical protein